MGDYQCWMCMDRGDCSFCSTFFEPDKVHSYCGTVWRVHLRDTNTDQWCCPDGDSHG